MIIITYKNKRRKGKRNNISVWYSLISLDKKKTIQMFLFDMIEFFSCQCVVLFQDIFNMHIKIHHPKNER